MNKSKTRFVPTPDDGANGGLDIALKVTQATLDAAWAAAECETATVIQLDEMELEIARFVSSALVQLHAASVSDTSQAILTLQENELPHAHQRPYILPIHIRISQFLRAALSCIPEMRMYVSVDGAGNGWVRQILSRDAGNSFGIWEQPREGDYKEGLQDELEMFGWGIWADASFFNHSMFFGGLFRPFGSTF
jgi:SET and MYND domain-containing protein